MPKKNEEKVEDTTAAENAVAVEIVEEPHVDPAYEMVDVFVERDPSDENPDMVIGINGKNWIMPRGETSTVPRYVADEYKRARKAVYKADENIKQMRGIHMAQP